MPDFLYVPDNPEYHVSESNNTLSINTKDLLSSVISDRIDHLYDSIRESNRLLLKRSELRNNNQLAISKDHVRIQNLLYELDSNSKTSLESQINRLHEEERNQELSHWKDTLELKRELRETEKELRTTILNMWMMDFLNS